MCIVRNIGIDKWQWFALLEHCITRLYICDVAKSYTWTWTPISWHERSDFMSLIMGNRKKKKNLLMGSAIFTAEPFFFLIFFEHWIHILSLLTEMIVAIMYWWCCGRQIGYHPDFESSRCLFIVRKDGELVDFSYWKCIKGLIRKNYPLHAESFILRHFRRRRRNFRR